MPWHLNRNKYLTHSWSTIAGFLVPVPALVETVALVAMAETHTAAGKREMAEEGAKEGMAEMFTTQCRLPSPHLHSQ